MYTVSVKERESEVDSSEAEDDAFEISSEDGIWFSEFSGMFCSECSEGVEELDEETDVFEIEEFSREASSLAIK